MLSTDLQTQKSTIDAKLTTAIARAQAYEANPSSGNKASLCGILDDLIAAYQAAISDLQAAKTSIGCGGA